MLPHQVLRHPCKKRVSDAIQPSPHRQSQLFVEQHTRLHCLISRFCFSINSHLIFRCCCCFCCRFYLISPRCKFMSDLLLTKATWSFHYKWSILSHPHKSILPLSGGCHQKWTAEQQLITVTSKFVSDSCTVRGREVT